jgi:hypothetical protein
MPAQLQHRLALASWVGTELGLSDMDALRSALRGQRDDWGTDPHTRFFRVIEGLESLRVAVDQLASYDDRIQEYAARLNTSRVTPIRLKYFQYAGLLFTELYLDRLFRDRNLLLADVNRHIEAHNSVSQRLEDEWPLFSPNDLKKAAFWMATGSGKSLVMHVNLWQFLHYCPASERPANILLVTPNYGLSVQHLRELRLSGIACRWFGDAAALTLFEHDPVTVIEITKLVETKRGGGLSVEVDAFGPNNLLLVDEAHRGASGDRWRELRRRLGAAGFTFEYSATFGQIVNGAPPAARDPLLDEYGKGILFDYSYRHFYNDGYGKDYTVLNLREEHGQFDQTVVLANALGFLDQRLAFLENRVDLSSYNIEQPLWVFVGHTVTGSTREDETTFSDVERLVVFLDGFTSNPTTTIQMIARILRGESGLLDARGIDVFAPAFQYLRSRGLTPQDIYVRLLERVFNTSDPGGIRGSRLTRGDGELALRVGHEPYFAVINVGDVEGIGGLLARRGIEVDADALTPSLFDRINDASSSTNVLIGSRKFMEGWDSFRVSTLGIMNVGRGEGAQIVQLFGRGVRLWGRDFSLRRTLDTPTDINPVALRAVETLAVFGLRANYMQQFRSYLEQEAIPVDFETIVVPTRVTNMQLGELSVPVLPIGADFSGARVVQLHCDEEISITLDLRPRLDLASSLGVGGAATRVAGADQVAEVRAAAAFIDWRRITADVEAFRVAKELWNLTVPVGAVRDVFLNGKVSIWASGSLRPRVPSDLRRLEGIISSAVRKYVAALYELRRRRWERDEIALAPLTAAHPNIEFGGYRLKMDASKLDRMKEIADLVSEGSRLFEEDLPALPSVSWRRHLYQPLILSDEGRSVFSSVPPGLDQHEGRFVQDLRAYVERLDIDATGWRVFLLRNLTRGRGIPFFDAVAGDAFYPDFILWLLGQQRQVICFVDPHGLRFSLGDFSDPKITLHRHLKAVAERLRISGGDDRVELNSVIISTSRYETVRRVFGGASRAEFRSHNVVFNESPDYIEDVLRIATAHAQWPLPTGEEGMLEAAETEKH